MPCDLRPGGQAIPIQRLVQGGVTAGQRTPLFVELLLVFRPRCFSKTPIFDALDVGQIFEDFLGVLEFLVHRGKVAQYHGRPGHKAVKIDWLALVLHQGKEPCGDLERIGRLPWRQALDESPQHEALGQPSRRTHAPNQSFLEPRHGAMAGQHHRHPVQLLGGIQGVFAKRIQHLVDEASGFGVRGGWLVQRATASALECKAVPDELPQFLASF